MLTKNELMQKLQKGRDFVPVDPKTTKYITFEARGCDISTPGYKGDIFNHRIVALIYINGVKVVIEATCTRTKRTTHAITGAPLKHEKVFYNDNGLHVDFSVEDFPTFEKGWGFGYRSFPSSFHAGSRWIYDVNDFHESAHTKKRLLACINAELKTHFEEIIIVNNCPSDYLTTSEALNDKYIKHFDNEPSDAEYNALYDRAKERWQMLQRVGIVPKNETFDSQACWITSGALHGFHFPNTQSPINAVIFGLYGRVICVIDDEE